MELQIWLISKDRKRMIENQRAVNRSGSMRAVCILSVEALNKVAGSVAAGDDGIEPPVLIVLEKTLIEENEEETLGFIKREDALAGIPLFIAVEERNELIDAECYGYGAMVVVHDILEHQEITRIEHVAWQYANTRRYEQKLQTQAAELRGAKEIMRLNGQLEARNRLLHRIFRRYFSDEVVDLIIEQGDDVSLGGEKREVTIMISDLRSFTAISEKLDPERVTMLLNHYYGKMVEIITSCHGTVIEFMGDGLLAVFGAPLRSDRSTDDAVEAAVRMQNAMEEVGVFCKENDLPGLEMGIGLHYGEVFVGNIGSEQIMRYNVIGSAVNECSRIESCSVGGQVLVSSELLEHTESQVEVAGTSEVMAKGFARPIVIHEVTGICGVKLSRTEDEMQVGREMPL